MDALVYHTTRYRKSKNGTAVHAAWIVKNLVRYLYLELPHQQLPLLMEMDGEFEAQQIRSWDPSSFPDWYRAKWPALQRAVEKLG